MNNSTSSESPFMLHFGAGNIGRSLVGVIFGKAGYRITFVDADQQVIAALAERHAYRVYIKDTLPPGTPDEIDVKGVDGLSAFDEAAIEEAVLKADLIGTAVGANALPVVLRNIARGLKKRTSPVSILFCENLQGVVELATGVLKKELGEDFPLEQRVGLVATSIGKMVPIMPESVRARDPLEVWGEAYSQIIADGQAFRGLRPSIPGLLLKDNFQAYVDRKLYVHNLGHAVCACEGALAGCNLLPEAMAIPAIAAATRAAMEASAKALMIRYPGEFTENEQQEHVEDLLRRFSNRALGDSVYRVGRDLKRKLAPGDRFMGALQLVKEKGGDTQVICAPIAAAMHFAARDEQGREMQSDFELREEIREKGPHWFLESFAALDPVLYKKEIELIETRYNQIAGQGCINQGNAT